MPGEGDHAIVHTCAGQVLLSVVAYTPPEVALWQGTECSVVVGSDLGKLR